MNPGLVIKLRPTGPWRIGPDSGARNRVDAIYHSDSLYSAVTSAMARLGTLEEWLNATARNGAAEVCLSSCFPFLDEIGFIVPPRTIWPPTSPGLMSGRVRWKSARFVPLGIVQAILAGQRLDPNHWSVDGASECLVPAGRPGPFRTGIRWSAAVDRLTGSAERHSTACIEFRPGAGLWTIVSFSSGAARERWLDPVKAAFRWLADSGFGGERSRGWGRSEAPEFIEGTLPDMIVPEAKGEVPVEAPAVEVAAEAEVSAPSEIAPLAGADETLPAEPGAPAAEAAVEPSEGEAEVRAPSAIEPLAVADETLPPDPEAEPPAAEPLDEAPEPRHSEPVPPTPKPEGAPSTGEPPAEEVVAEELAATPVTEPPAAEGVTVESPGTAVNTETPAEEAVVAGESGAAPVTERLAAVSEAPADEVPAETPVEPPAVEEAFAAELATAPVTEPPAAVKEAPVGDVPAGTPAAEEPVAANLASGLGVSAPAPSTPEPESRLASTAPHTAIPGFWILSLYTPAPEDSVDWQRGNYTVVVRGGRVDSPAGSGELKKQVQMVAEGSVLAATSAPRGGATDVAPDGFAHPVFRAGFAVCIPLPEVS